MFSVYTSGGGSGSGGGGGEESYTDADVDQAVQSIEQTWNDAGVLFTGIGLDVTDTASDADSLLMRLRRGGNTRFSVSTNGTVEAFAYDTLGGSCDLKAAGTTVLRATENLGVQVGPEIVFGTAATNRSAHVVYESLDTLSMRRGAFDQEFRVHSFYTSSNDHLFVGIREDPESGAMQLYTEKGSSSAGAVPLQFVLQTGALQLKTPDGTLHLEIFQSGIRPHPDRPGQNLGLNLDGYMWEEVYVDGFHQLKETTTPSTPSGAARIYSKDDGTGKTQLVVLLPDGVETVLATES